jgi:hypothetical protein
VCDANYYCRVPTLKEACPVHTWSSVGAFSQFQCRCDEGYVCSYTKQIQTTVLLNCSLYDFNNDVNHVKTDFLASLAAAAGVPVSNVVINGVTGNVGLPGGNRRNQNVVSTVEVRATVMGAVSLVGLEHQMQRRSAHLHLHSNSWNSASNTRAIRV